MSQYIQTFLHDGDQIRCEHKITSSQPQGYPVLTLEGVWGTVAIFPGGRLERLYEVIGAYLAAHRRPVPAEACTGVDTVAITWPGGRQEFRAVPGATVDVDELIGSMAESYEVRRDIP